jgi:hypothetical protein
MRVRSVLHYACCFPKLALQCGARECLVQQGRTPGIFSLGTFAYFHNFILLEINPCTGFTFNAAAPDWLAAR